MRPGVGALCGLLSILLMGVAAHATDPCEGIVCDDGDACNGVETCVDGACQPGTPLVCDDGDACNGVETCAGGACQPGTPLDCDDGNPCDGVETCAGGACQPGTPLNCDDGNVCTTDHCNPGLGCINAPNTGPCAGDGNQCTVDVCASGSCTHPLKPDGTGCNDGLYCTVDDACIAGACQSGPPNCTSLSTACKTGNCDETLDRCFTTPHPNGTPCGDAEMCNGVETCQGGLCRTDPVPDCDDDDPCTTDVCEIGAGCVHSVLPDGTSCNDDGRFCNGAEVCRAGVCAAALQPACDDGNACTFDTCDEVLETCTHRGPPNCCRVDADCADTDLCTVAERCRGGRCESDRIVCPGGSPCVRATCNPQLGCAMSPLADGEECEDGDPCTEGETCSALVCSLPPAESAATTSYDLVVTKFVLQSMGRRVRLVAQGWFPTQAAAAVLDDGIAIEVRNPQGTTLYEASVPGFAFRPQGGRGLVYKARGATPFGGVKQLRLQIIDQAMRISLKAAVPTALGTFAAVQPPGDVAGGETELAWAVRVGDECVRDPDLVCAGDAPRRRTCQ